MGASALSAGDELLSPSEVSEGVETSPFADMMTWTGSEDRTDEEREPLLRSLVKHIALLILSLSVYALYALHVTPRISYTMAITLSKFSTLALYIALLLFIIKDLLAKCKRASVAAMNLALTSLALSAILGGIAELAELRYVNYGLLPPFFVIERCPTPYRCNGFGFLDLSIPLIITFALALYAALGVAKSLAAGRIKERGKIEERLSSKPSTEDIS